MATEIERKFLVRGNDWRQGRPLRISQGYLNRDKARTVRIRIAENRAYLTIKGPSQGASRPEYEYEIPRHDAEELMALCEGPPLEKNRYTVPHAGVTWEIDEFTQVSMPVSSSQRSSSRMRSKPFSGPPGCLQRSPTILATSTRV